MYFWNKMEKDIFLLLKRNKRLKWLYTYTMWIMSFSSDDLMNSHNILHWEMVSISCFLVGGVILRLVLDPWLPKWKKKTLIFPKCCYDKALYIKDTTTQKSDSGLIGSRALRGGLDSAQRQPLNWILGNPELHEIQMENCDQDHLDGQEEKVGIFFSQLLFIIIRTESTQLTG